MIGDYIAGQNIGGVLDRSGLVGVTSTSAAYSRARQLLVQHLSEEQRLSFRKRGWFYVCGEITRCLYSISKRPQYNIRIERTTNFDLSLDEHMFPFFPLYLRSRVLVKGDRLCVEPIKIGQALPIYDVLLAQKIGLENDELQTLSLAHHRKRSALWWLGE